MRREPSVLRRAWCVIVQSGHDFYGEAEHGIVLPGFRCALCGHWVPDPPSNV